MAKTFTVTERLYLTNDDKLVKEGDPRAAFLYSTPGKEIPMVEAEKYGLAPTAKAASAPADKAKAAPANKAVRKTAKKS